MSDDVQMVEAAPKKRTASKNTKNKSTKSRGKTSKKPTPEAPITAPNEIIEPEELPTQVESVPEPAPTPIVEAPEPTRARSRLRSIAERRRSPPRREQFFSQRHPGAYHLVASIPTFAMTAVVAVIGYLVLLNMDRITTLILDPDIVLDYLERNGVMLLILIAMLAVLTYIVYTVGWRYLFPDYYIRYGSADVFDGRLYWSDNHILVRLWDRWYGSPPRTQIRYYVHQSRLPLVLNVITTSPEEWMERKDMWSVVVYERSLRMVVERRKKRTYFETYDDTYHHLAIPTEYVGSSFDVRMKQMLDATTRASYGNPEVSVDIVRNGSTLIGEDFAEAVRNARTNEEQTAT
jgi:hypothetical protein